MKPTENDVLSGRGAGFNQHPGNEHFRRIIEEQKAIYIKGTKKQKVNMSNAIVESIYSMEPPGRFLKQCPDTGRWNELSKREAADRVAQAMAYAVRGKEKLKQQREERRRSRSSPRQKSKDDAAAKSSQRADRPARLRSHATNNNNELEDSSSLSAARHDGIVARGEGTVGMNNNAQSASSVLLHPDDSSLQQQLLIQQLLQSSSTTTLPPSAVSPTMDQNGLARLLLQTLQQQQQQLPLQHTLGQDSLGLQTQTPLQPALLEGWTQLLNQTQQQQQRNEQQQQEEQQLLLQRLLNQQTEVPSAKLPPTLSLSAPFLMGPRSHPTNSALLQNQVHLQSNPSNALLLSKLSTSLHQPNSTNDVGISHAPPGAQQMDQLQRSLMLQHQQLLASSLGASSNDHLYFQQQQSQPLDPLLRHAMQAPLQLQQNNSQGLLPPPPINFAALAAANAAAQSTRQEESED